MPAKNPLGRTSLALVVAVALCVGVLAGCSSSASTRAGADTTGKGGTTTEPAKQVALPKTVPAGTTLRVGDQLDYLKTVLKLAGEDQDYPYKVEYSAFIGGPPMLQAFQGKALDTGFVGSTPLIFAQAAGQDLKAVAGWTSDIGSYGLVAAPGHDDIEGWGDLKGKKVAYQQGTAGEAVLLEALDKEGLKLSDITTVNLPQTQINSALQGGSADAAVQVEPLTSLYLAGAKGAAQVGDATAITDRSSFLLASQSVLDDKAKTAALADFTARIVRAFTYLAKHPEKIAKAVFVDTYHLPAARAKELTERGKGISFLDLSGGDILKAQQKLADLFQANDEITAKVDVTGEFDTRFADLITAAAKAAKS